MSLKTEQRTEQRTEELPQTKNVGVKFFKKIDLFKFSEETVKSANIRQLSSNFDANFFGHLEEEIQPTNVVVCQLQKDCGTNFMGQFLKETKLAHFLGLVQLQSNGENGEDKLLRADGRNNVALIRGKRNKPQIVVARWMGLRNCKKYWFVEAFLNGDDIRWQTGIHIVLPCCFKIL